MPQNLKVNCFWRQKACKNSRFPQVKLVAMQMLVVSCSAIFSDFSVSLRQPYYIYIYIITRKPGRSPTLKRTLYALSCPFCLAQFWLLGLFFCIFERIACFCTYLKRKHVDTRVQSATEWTASVHTLHMSKPVM